MNTFDTTLDQLDVTVTVSGQTMTLTAVDVSVQVKYAIHGEYLPATYLEPAEYPEVELHAVTLNTATPFFDENSNLILTLHDGHDIWTDLSAKQIANFEDRAYEDAEERQADAEDERADYLYDQQRDLLAERAA